MNVIPFMFLCLIHLAFSQFQPHLDLQKAGEIIFNNEKYNVLKPTVHEVTDHFKDFVLRRENEPDQRIFIDDNGFRHHWTGMALSHGNLRRAVAFNPNVQAEFDNQKAHKNVEVKPPITESKIEGKTIQNMKLEESKSGKKHAITSFFCPFFGIITMHSTLH